MGFIDFFSFSRVFFVVFGFMYPQPYGSRVVLRGVSSEALSLLATTKWSWQAALHIQSAPGEVECYVAEATKNLCTKTDHYNTGLSK